MHKEIEPPSVGQKFGKLKLISFKEGKQQNAYSTISECDCGNIVEMDYGRLRGRKSCGICYKTYLNELIGKRFTNLVVESTYSKNWRTYCICKCDCGEKSTVVLSKLNNKTTRSCGCHLYGKSVVGESSRNELIQQYKNRAKKRNLDFELNNDELEVLFKSNCYYCNIPPSQYYNKKKLNGSYTYNGIDRLDNNKGYILNNVVACCGMCNWMKLDHSEESFLNKVKAIYLHSCKESESVRFELLENEILMAGNC